MKILILLQEFVVTTYYSLVVAQTVVYLKMWQQNIRTFDGQSRDRFLVLSPIEDCTAKAIIQTTLKLWDKNQIPIKN